MMMGSIVDRLMGVVVFVRRLTGIHEEGEGWDSDELLRIFV